MNIKLWGSRVLVRKVEPENTTASGIVLSCPVDEDSMPEGEVLAVGTKVNSDVSVGDKVLFGKYAGQTLRWDGENLLVIALDEVLGVIQKEPDMK